MTVHPDDSAVRLVDPRPETWRARAAEFAERIHAAAPDAHVEHIGSTSIPGIRAKDMVDLLVGVSRDRIGAARSALEGIGFVLEGDRSDHAWLCHPSPGNRQVIVHVVELGGRQWERRMRFRDALREDERLAGEYEELKVALASSGIGLDEYTQRKTDFVRAVLD